MVEKEKSGKTTLTIAHVGDSRVVLMTAGKAIRMTRDHKGSDVEEQKRIISCGGTISKDRVGGSLAVTRAFGDFFYKKSGVTSEPEIN